MEVAETVEDWRLSDRKRRGLVVLLNVRSITEASRNSGISERSLQRWLTDPAFRSAYREASRRILEDAVALPNVIRSHIGRQLGKEPTPSHFLTIPRPASSVVRIDRPLPAVESEGQSSKKLSSEVWTSPRLTSPCSLASAAVHSSNGTSPKNISSAVCTSPSETSAVPLQSPIQRRAPRSKLQTRNHLTTPVSSSIRAVTSVGSTMWVGVSIQACPSGWLPTHHAPSTYSESGGTRFRRIALDTLRAHSPISAPTIWPIRIEVPQSISFGMRVRSLR